MTAISKFYLHNAATTDTGTLPGASSVGTVTATVTATGATTNRSMDGVVGVGQTSSSLTTSATKSAQSNWHRRFLSAPIAAQTIAAQTISTDWAYSQSNANSNIKRGYCLAVWRPGSGSVVGRIWDTVAFTGADSANTTQIGESTISGTGSAVTAQDGDILVFELWTFNTQGKASAYTNSFFYDGTTDSSTTNESAWVNFDGGAITMQSLVRVPKHPAINHQNPALLFKRWWQGWSLRPSGTLVPA